MDINQNKHREAFKVTESRADQPGQLKEEFLQLTDTDLKFEANKENEMPDRIAFMLNKNRDEVIDSIDRGLMWRL